VARKRWSDLSPRARRAIVVVGMAEAALKAAMLMDLRHRTPEQVKGSKRLWGWSALVNSAGLIPISYFLFGRKGTRGAE
jgi:hypothetical protein